jgi:hypothetical protein
MDIDRFIYTHYIFEACCPSKHNVKGIFLKSMAVNYSCPLNDQYHWEKKDKSSVHVGLRPHIAMWWKLLS